MLVVLVPFVSGILLAEHFVVPLYLAVALFAVAVILTYIAMPQRVAWGYAALALLAFGYTIAELRAPSVAVPYAEECEMVVEVEGIPSQRDDYRVADGRIVQWYDGERWHDSQSSVLLWLRCDSVGEGDRVYMCGRLNEDISRYDDYNRLMHRRGYVGGVGVNDYNIISITHSTPTDLQSKAIARLNEYATDNASHATVVAMVAGSRHAMPNNLREAYSRTGLSHLMAVSGLHLGIVLMVVGFMLMPLRLLHGGHRIAALLSIIAIWFYAIMSGASPSVVRAAIMLSVLQLSIAASARYNSLNALAVTLFAMLVYRPNYLFDISFQLSVAAVMGIVAWGVPLVRSSRSWPRLVSSIYSLFVVGAVATLWTLPIISHTFGNLPIIGVVVTPFVLLFAYAIVACGIFAVVLPPPLGYPFAMVAEWAARMQNIVVEWAAELPFASVEWSMPKWGVALCYLLYAAITLLYWSKNQKKVVTLPRYDWLERP
ncbi:MAG: ComEC/Rec2 family competence protein [Alistipes sp.]|nr:ComEC/Rec2 family competence protein [Alistipes sp.]